MIVLPGGGLGWTGTSSNNSPTVPSVPHVER